MGWREQKAAARETVHKTFELPAVLLSSIPVNSNTTETAVTVRLHNRQAKLGDQAGTSFNSAERWEENPRLLFWRAALVEAGIELKRNMVISIGAGEAYNIEVVRPHDTETITVETTRLSEDEATGLPVPA